MTNRPTEITIVDGGMAGGALTLELVQHGFTATAIEHAQPVLFVAGGQLDARISAISAASVSLPKGIGAWDAVQAIRCYSYHRLEMWEQETTHVVSDAVELRLPLFGYTVENTILQQALWQALETHPEVTLRVSGLPITLRRRNDPQELELKGGETILAKLVTNVDDANSQVRQMVGIGAHVWQYAWSCMLVSVQCENDPGDSTWQQFTPDGLRAFLLLFNNQVSLVWYDSPARIYQLQNMNMAQLQAEVVEHFSSRLGYVIPLVAGAFPLIRCHALQYVQLGPALVGNVAHTIHPLVGQGVNLGYRDVDALIDVLVNARSYGEARASYPVLKRYQMRCMADNLMIQGDMDLFYTGFSNNLPLLRFVRNLGLMAVERADVSKRQALKYALGLQSRNIVGCMSTVGRIRRDSVVSDFEG